MLMRLKWKQQNKEDDNDGNSKAPRFEAMFRIRFQITAVRKEWFPRVTKVLFMAFCTSCVALVMFTLRATSALSRWFHPVLPYNAPRSVALHLSHLSERHVRCPSPNRYLTIGHITVIGFLTVFGLFWYHFNRVILFPHRSKRLPSPKLVPCSWLRGTVLHQSGCLIFIQRMRTPGRGSSSFVAYIRKWA